MNPSEKALDLFARMKGFRVKHSHSKKCAIVAVDEMISNEPWNVAIEIDDKTYTWVEYWTEVKNELLKLK